MAEKRKYYCVVCDKELDFEPRMCCNGFQCGCMGQPVDPLVCSDECFEKAYGAGREEQEEIEIEIEANTLWKPLEEFMPQPINKSEQEYLDHQDFFVDHVLGRPPKDDPIDDHNVSQ